MNALSCTLESEDESVMDYGHIRFGSPNEVINDVDLVCLGEDKAQVKNASQKQHSLRPEATVEGRSTGRAVVDRPSGLPGAEQWFCELAQLVEHTSSGRATYRTTH